MNTQDDGKIDICSVAKRGRKREKEKLRTQGETKDLGGHHKLSSKKRKGGSDMPLTVEVCEAPHKPYS